MKELKKAQSDQTSTFVEGSGKKGKMGKGKNGQKQKQK